MLENEKPTINNCNGTTGVSWDICSFLIVMLEKTLESPLDCKEIKRVNPKGNQPSVFIGRTDSLEKTLMLGKI